MWYASKLKLFYNKLVTYKIIIIFSWVSIYPIDKVFCHQINDIDSNFIYTKKRKRQHIGVPYSKE